MLDAVLYDVNVLFLPGEMVPFEARHFSMIASESLSPFCK
jgi:hypothetical protein